MCFLEQIEKLDWGRSTDRARDEAGWEGTLGRACPRWEEVEQDLGPYSLSRAEGLPVHPPSC